MSKFTTQYFIDKFEKIPESKWTTGEWSKKGKKCALGHCGSGLLKETEESSALNGLFYKYFSTSVIFFNDDILHVGSSGHLDFKLEGTPKQRVLTALYFIRAFEQHGVDF